MSVAPSTRMTNLSGAAPSRMENMTGHTYERQEMSCNNFRMRGSSRLLWVDFSE